MKSSSNKSLTKILVKAGTIMLILILVLAGYLLSWRLRRLEVPEQTTVVELRTEKNIPEKKYLIFCSRFSANPVGFPGHCFVIWADEIPVKNFSKVESHGFFPTEYKDQFVAFFKSVPATLVSEPVSSNPEALSFRLLAVVSPEVYSESKLVVEKWKTNRFKIGSTDCIGFAKAVAESVGLKTPTRPSIYPQDFINQLNERNHQSDSVIDTEKVVSDY